MNKKVLFIFQNGGLFAQPYNRQTGHWPQLAPKAVSSLAKIVTELDYELALVNDAVITPVEQSIQNNIIRMLEPEGIVFAGILNKDTALQQYLYGNYDLERSFVTGPAENISRIAEKTGCISLTGEAGTTIHWEDVYRRLKSEPRKATVKRITSETSITVTVNLDGTGKSNIDTSIGFFDHMLEQVARHGNMNLDISVKGDLHIDEHHTIEDTAIAFGDAVMQALGTKKGIERYGFLLPMDDCLAQVAIDFGGRPWLVWNATFNREKIGEMPTEMFFHFFKSFSDHAQCNLNISAGGDNEHHKIEAIFKAFAKAIKMALTQNNQPGIPSTKGIL